MPCAVSEASNASDPAKIRPGSRPCLGGLKNETGTSKGGAGSGQAVRRPYKQTGASQSSPRSASSGLTAVGILILPRDLRLPWADAAAKKTNRLLTHARSGRSVGRPDPVNLNDGKTGKASVSHSIR